MKVMKANWVDMPQFQGLVVDSVQVNYNVIYIMFGPSKNPTQPLHNK
jgi:hypothetical protein